LHAPPRNSHACRRESQNTVQSNSPGTWTKESPPCPWFDGLSPVKCQLPQWGIFRNRFRNITRNISSSENFCN
jgi:hypothetical protein